MRQPYAYLRKSRVFRGKDIISPEMQLTQVTELAGRHGDTGLVVLTDLNKSGRRRDRPGFQALLQAIEADQVSAVYSYSLSRLSRSISAIVELAEACSSHGVPIRLARDIDPDPTTASGRLMMNLLAAMAQFEADVAVERARDTVEARRARGDKLGPPFFAQPDLVAAAFEEAGSISGAAKLLTRRGVPTRNGNRLWSATSVSRILRRQGVLGAPAKRGVTHRGHFMFSQLLRCHCKHTLLTGRRDGGHASAIAYYCAHSRIDPDHGKTGVSERSILAWAIDEAARLDAGSPAALGDKDTEQKRAELVARRERLNRAASRASNDDEEAGYVSEIEGIDAELERLEAGTQLVSLDAIVWDVAPDLVNDQLRALWDHIELDDQMQPVRALWRVPEWRRPEPEPVLERDAAAAV